MKSAIDKIQEKYDNLIAPAVEEQIQSGFESDKYKILILKNGTEVYRLCNGFGDLGSDCWFINKEDIINSHYDYTTIYNGLQIPLGTKYWLAKYFVTNNYYAAFCIASNNTTYGSGGFTRYYIKNWENCLTFSNSAIYMGH